MDAPDLLLLVGRECVPLVPECLVLRRPLNFLVFDYGAEMMKVCHQGVNFVILRQNAGSHGQRVNNSCDGVEVYYLWSAHVRLVMEPMTEPVVYLKK